MTGPGLPPPYALGLPDKFLAWRADQEHAVDLILNAPTRFVALNMPTGSGKSLVYMAGAHLAGFKTVCLTANKYLQTQVGHDFSSLAPVDIRGQSTYPCLALRGDGELSHLRAPDDGHQDVMCDQGPCRIGFKCTLKTAGCIGYDKIREARDADLVITNYALHIAQARYAEGLGSPGLVVCDEAHGAHDELASGLTISLSKWLCSILDLHPDPAWDIESWKNWAVYHAAKLKARLEAPVDAHQPKDLKFRKWCKQAEQTLTAMSLMQTGNWIEDSDSQAYKFEILHPKTYAEQYLWQGAKRVVLLSATLTPKTLNLLGIADSQVTYWECPSRFPVARRPVWYVPTALVKHPITPGIITSLAVRLDQILLPRADRKGIGHTVSYKLAESIYSRSTEQGRIRLDKSGTSTAQTVHAFKLSPGPDVLLSPAIDTGVDFPDAECRFQIVFRLPFPSTQSKIVQARAALDPDYVPYLMLQRLIQSVGRGVRSETDWCETFILDNKWSWARGKYKALMPAWFRAAFKDSGGMIPPPLNL